MGVSWMISHSIKSTIKLIITVRDKNLAREPFTVPPWPGEQITEPIWPWEGITMSQGLLGRFAVNKKIPDNSSLCLFWLPNRKL